MFFSDESTESWSDQELKSAANLKKTPKLGGPISFYLPGGPLAQNDLD